MPTLDLRGSTTPSGVAVREGGPSLSPRRLGDWVCLEQVGSGRWTNLYRARPANAPAHHPADYVLKVLREDVRDVALARQTLQRDALVAGEVCHPRLAAVLATHLATPPYYLAAPFLEGITLGGLLESLEGRSESVRYLPLGRTLWIVRQLAEGLAELHRRGWLHGDLKPANVILNRRGEATLFDFGLARRLNSPECRAVDAWYGTLRYAPPESFVPQRGLTAASDVYSLGLMLFELLTNVSPLAGVPADDVPRAHLERPLPDLADFRRDLPRTLVQLVRQMTAKEPLRRPTDEELVRSLTRMEIECFAEQ